jgi:hypothetical protein
MGLIETAQHPAVRHAAELETPRGPVLFAWCASRLRGVQRAGSRLGDAKILLIAEQDLSSSVLKTNSGSRASQVLKRSLQHPATPATLHDPAGR